MHMHLYVAHVHVSLSLPCTVFTSYTHYYEVESTFPLYSIPLVSGAFFNKERNGPACALQPEAQAADRRAATSAATRPPPTRHESRHEAGTSHGTPEPSTAGRAPAAPRAIAVRYAEQQRVVAEARARLNHGLNPPRLNPLLGGSWRAGATKTTTTTWGARNSANEDGPNVSTGADTRKKHGKWFHRLRDR